MSSVLVLFLGALQLGLVPQHNYTNDGIYYSLPRFWTHTGLCPTGSNREEIRDTLLSQAMLMNLQHIAAMPSGSLTHVRTHWMLELIRFKEFTQAGVPIYDFDDLDRFIIHLHDLKLLPVVEFMCEMDGLFRKNPKRNEFYWENLVYQITKRYLDMLGGKQLSQWYFETWNEPDSQSYNHLNFTSEDFWKYSSAVKMGLKAAGKRPKNSLQFLLRGPAGLFKNETIHPLCWESLNKCNANVASCPFQILTYHRKGNGLGSEVIDSSRQLVGHIFAQYPNLKNIPISNDEADPIPIWSIPREFQADVRYAVSVLTIIFDHWKAKLKEDDFMNLESISHDNAFLSYHPHEFTQRTLLAHFRMNNSLPVHSQFIQKPIYAALAMMSRLGSHATDVEELNTSKNSSISLLKTIDNENNALALSWVILPRENASHFGDFIFEKNLTFSLCKEETYFYIIESLQGQLSDPFYTWTMLNRPPYPNATERELMRKRQTPKIYSTGTLTEPRISIPLGDFRLPWIIMVRICSNIRPLPQQPMELNVQEVTTGEVLVTWQETEYKTQCLKAYEIFHRVNDSSKWNHISTGWQLPFPMFHFAPTDRVVNGFYKVRALDIMGNKSKFSQIMEYIEL